MSRTEVSGRRITSVLVVAFVVDVLVVVVFAAIGRASHDEGVWGPGGSGLFQTAWPFIVALIVGWLGTLAWRRPLAPVRTGLGVWAITVVGGMLLRALSGQGTALAFIVVAAVTLLVFLVGWRVAVAFVTRARTQRERK